MTLRRIPPGPEPRALANEQWRTRRWRKRWRNHWIGALLAGVWVLGAPEAATRLVAHAPSAAAAAADEPAAAPSPADAGRARAVAGLRTKLRKAARSPHAAKKRETILEYLGALESLGGWEAGRAALEAAVLEDAELRDRIFNLVEREHHERLVPRLVEFLEDKDFRRDADLRRRIAHAFAVIAHSSTLEPLATLMRSDEPAEVVDEAAKALAGHVGTPVPLLREPVRRCIELYEATYNLMMSMQAEDRILRKVMAERWKVYGKSLRTTLQLLAGQPQLSVPQEWRRWWNDNKKADTWQPPVGAGGRG